MSIEQDINMQELAEEDYTNVYAGCGHLQFSREDMMKIYPEIPTPPNGHTIEI